MIDFIICSGLPLFIVSLIIIAYLRIRGGKNE